MIRVSAFIDGFNFYHAIDDLGAHHLKWVDLWALCRQYAPSPDLELTQVFYFSAFATWRPNAYKRHREYVKALRSVGVTPVMGKFKAKDRQCRKCGQRWVHHEEKETDVNIALYLLSEATKDTYDRALLVSGDSDLGPAIRMVRSQFPDKQLRILAPLGRGYSMDLFNAAGGKQHCRQLRDVHVERALFPKEVLDANGKILAVRPAKYEPPSPPVAP